MTTRITTPRYIRLDDEVWKVIAEEARRGRRPLSSQLELIVLEWLKLKDLEGMLDSVEEDEK